MNVSDKEILNNNKIFLTNNMMHLHDVIGCLTHDRVLSKIVSTELINDKRRNYSDKINMMLYYLSFGGPTAFTAFINALCETGQSDVAHCLRSPYKK